MKKIYNKLVRDKIPEIIRKDNKSCSIRILDDEEFLISLNAKLQEEVNEYLESNDVCELADIEEVIKAILEYKNISTQDFEKIRLEKVSKRGSFKKKIFLESVNDNND